MLYSATVQRRHFEPFGPNRQDTFSMNFFGIGYGEILIIIVAALIIFGPQRLPEVAGQAARWIRDARKMLTDMSGEFERNAGVREFKQAIEGEIAGVRKDLQEAGVSVKKDLDAAAGTANKAFGSASKTIKGSATTSKSKSSTATPSTAKKAASDKPATSVTGRTAKPKATKADPFAGLVQMTEVTPKQSRAAAGTSANGATGSTEHDPEPLRETNEAVARARERRLAAGYNRRLAGHA
jgi:sec-independent protein translocase protein TatB